MPNSVPFPATVTPRILEALHREALSLCDAARAPLACDDDADGDPAGEALACESMRTTMRMMHALNWLRNQQDHMAGTLREVDLPTDPLPNRIFTPSAEHLALLSPHVVAVIDASHRFYTRLVRLEQILTTPSEAPRRPFDMIYRGIEHRLAS